MQTSSTQPTDQIDALIKAFKAKVPDATIIHEGTAITLRLILPMGVYGPKTIDYRSPDHDTQRQVWRVRQFFRDHEALIAWERAGRPGDEI